MAEASDILDKIEQPLRQMSGASSLLSVRKRHAPEALMHVIIAITLLKKTHYKPLHDLNSHFPDRFSNSAADLVNKPHISKINSVFPYTKNRNIKCIYGKMSTYSI